MKQLLFSITVLTVLVLSFGIESCYYDNEEELYPSGTTNPTNCDTAAIKYSVFVSPLIASKCATSGCHNAATAAAGVNLSSYNTTKAFLNSNKTAFFGSIKHQSGFSAMPQGGSKLADCDINKLQSWVNAGLLNN